MRWCFVVVFVITFSVLRVQSAVCQNQKTLSNGYYSVAVENGSIRSLLCDPDGKGNFGVNILEKLAFDGIVASEETHCSPPAGDATPALKWTDMAAVQKGSINIKDCHIPVEVMPGSFLGQTFEVPGTFDSLAVKVPTWHSTTSSATIQLLKDGKVIAKERFDPIQDNAYVRFRFEQQPAGQYEVRLLEPKGGRVGWWSADKDIYADGAGTSDGKADISCDRALEVPYSKAYSNKAEVSVILDNAKLSLAVAIPEPTEKIEIRHNAIFSVSWEWDGYDTTPKGTPFKRVYSDQQRFMPIEQLKRNDHNPVLNCGQGFHFDGTGDYDLEMSCGRSSLHWSYSKDHLGMTIRCPFTKDENGVTRATITLRVLPREDRFPDDWPAFETSDKDMDHDLNLMLYERNFSYPSPCGPAPWIEWSAIARAWFAGAMRDGEKRHAADIVMDETGYVHTWGGRPGWPFPDNNVYDTRHFDTNARLILSVWRYTLWTGDLNYLIEQLPRLRKAMQYQLTVLDGTSGLIKTVSKDVNGRHRGVGNNYWDILPFGHLDAYANAAFYASLEAMAQLEEVFEQRVAEEQRQSLNTETELHTPEYYRALRQKTLAEYTTKFWDEKEGRFIGCIDIDGNRHDYGFTFLNLESMYYGLASPEQIKRIYNWMENGLSSTGKADIYSAWVFAPRATTIHNPMWNNEHPDGLEENMTAKPWWHFGWTGTSFGDQCQDGGAIFYTSFFDLANRARFLGADDAYRRWQEILVRYREPDRLCGGTPLFRGEVPQRVDPGAVGLDVPFPESGMVPCWVLYGMMGIEPTPNGLRIKPNLPSQLEFCAVRNVSYRNLP
ncbi:MAG TPA: GH116 family glycosyl hydrolase, partial [bacterium]|nr:GH116 family glycosyl hydrolase [bacterium]